MKAAIIGINEETGDLIAVWQHPTELVPPGSWVIYEAIQENYRGMLKIMRQEDAEDWRDAMVAVWEKDADVIDGEFTVLADRQIEAGDGEGDGGGDGRAAEADWPPF